jgi:pimeloyl-ACP methyl ester carboxylesterase
MRRSRRTASFVIALAATAALAFAAPAMARETRITVPTPAGPGPAQYNQVFVDQYGPADGKRVLVLMPGTSGGSGNFTLAARYIVKHVPDLQVWAIDRRSQALEDRGVFEQALKGQVSLQYMFDYYLGWLDGGGPSNHFKFLNGGVDFPFVRDWGMKVALDDARAVVLKARAKGKRKVVLGGHSLGASLTAAYASWDFNGTPGYKDIEGMVLIDGGLLGSFDPFTLQQAQAAVGALSVATPFADLLGIGLPEAAGLFGEVGAINALKDPAGSALNVQSFALLPPAFNPAFPVTNRALLGNAFDRDTSPSYLSLLHINSGSVESSGPLRDFLPGGITPVERLAAGFGQEPGNGIEWYFPRKLTIDTNGANALVQNDVADYLGLRLLHQRKVDVPLYAIQTDLTNGGVLRGANAFIDTARTKRKESRLINADPEQSHLDPLLAAPRQNAFYKTITPFLRYKAFGDPKPCKKSSRCQRNRKGGAKKNKK